MTQAEQPSRTIAPGTPLQKVIPPRLVEPYLSGQRSVIAGFVYLAQDSAFPDPASYYDALALGYEGSEFSPDMGRRPGGPGANPASPGHSSQAG